MKTINKNIVEVVADYFAHGDPNEALKVLNKKSMQWRRIDIAMISFFGGSSVLMLCIMEFITELCPDLSYNNKDKTRLDFWKSIESSNPIYRFGFILWYSLFAAGFCIHVWRKYDINYYHVFDLHPDFKIHQ